MPFAVAAALGFLLSPLNQPGRGGHYVRHDLWKPQACDPGHSRRNRDLHECAKGHSSLQLSRDLDVQYKSACVLSHKMREAIASLDKGAKVSGNVRHERP